MITLTHLSEAFRIFRYSLRRKKNGFKKYEGNAEEICKQIVEDCWNGRYFQVSNGHFCEFYMRDFGWCCEALLKLGYRNKVIKTLDFALGIYSKNNRLTTTITPNGKVVDIYEYSPDGLAYLMRCLRLADAKKLVEKYKNFLDAEIYRYFRKIFDENTGLVRKDRYFSSMKDYSERGSSCYDNIMIAMLSKELDKLGFNNPFKNYDMKKNIKDNFWNGGYFYDDLSKKEYVSGDANLYPFWLGVFDNEDMLKSAVDSMIKAGLDNPFPLKYSSERKGKKFNIIEKILVPNYEGNAIWSHMGPLCVELLRKVDKKRAKLLLDKYKMMIEKYGNYLEVFDSKGLPYKTLFYYTDEGMIWAVNYVIQI